MPSWSNCYGTEFLIFLFISLLLIKVLVVRIRENRTLVDVRSTFLTSRANSPLQALFPWYTGKHHAVNRCMEEIGKEVKGVNHINFLYNGNGLQSWSD